MIEEDKRGNDVHTEEKIFTAVDDSDEEKDGEKIPVMHENAIIVKKKVMVVKKK